MRIRTVVTILAGIGAALSVAGCGSENDSDDNPSVAEEVVGAPVFSPPGGTYSGPQTLTMTCPTPHTFISYTLDGSDPTKVAGILYKNEGLVINSSVTVKAVASTQWSRLSAVTSADYTILDAPKSSVVPPSFDPVPGTYTSAQNITISSTTNGAKIYFTTDGTTPNTSSPVYASPVNVGVGTTTLKAYATAEGYQDSAVQEGTYAIQIGNKPHVATPRFDPVPGTYTSAQDVTISCTTPDAEIHYTLDGANPNAGSPIYGSPIRMTSGTTTLKAMALFPGHLDSAIQSGTYSINEGGVTATPTFTPSGGAVDYGSTVTIASTTPGAVIFYTVDGITNPSVPGIGNRYTDPIAVTLPLTLKAVAKAEGLGASDMATADFTLRHVLFADACTAWNAAIAARKVSCLHANPDYLAGLHGALDCTTLKADIDAGLTTYDESKADACTADLQALPCGGLLSGTPLGPFEFPVLGTACEGILVGTGVSTIGQGTGTECRRSTQCASGYCPTTTLPGQCPGVCEGRVAEGVECAYSQQCAAGLTCASGTCRARGTTGTSCYMDERCAADLRCLDGTCKAPLADGGACTYDFQCVAEDRCFGGTCQPLVGLGGACTEAAAPNLPTVCGDGYWCDSGTCVAYPTAGHSCTDSVACTGGYCDFSGNEPTCAAYLDVGAHCTSKAQCRSQLASYDGICIGHGEFYCATP